MRCSRVKTKSSFVKAEHLKMFKKRFVHSNLHQSNCNRVVLINNKLSVFENKYTQKSREHSYSMM